MSHVFRPSMSPINQSCTGLATQHPWAAVTADCPGDDLLGCTGGRDCGPPLSLAGKAVVLDEQSLDVLCQQLIVLHAPVPQDAGGELVIRMARPA